MAKGKKKKSVVTDSRLSTITYDASGTELADWMEIQALIVSDGGVSAAELATTLKISGCVDSLGDNKDAKEADGDAFDAGEAASVRAFDELTRRNDLYSVEVYPFDLSGEHLQPKDWALNSVYLFLRLLRDHNLLQALNDDAVRQARKLFESLAASALAAYLGGKTNGVESFVFGFPRRERLPKAFRDALNALCKKLGEGDKCKSDAPLASQAKDDGLDVVAWREFPDRRRSSKLIVFGQCATGNDWEKKLCDLPSTSSWCSTWLTRAPFVDPVRSFFVPVVIDDDSWEYASRRAGILFDSARIAVLAMAKDLNAKDLRGIRKFNKTALAHIRKEGFPA